MVTGAYFPELSGGGLQCRTLVRALKDRVRFLVFSTTLRPELPHEDEIDGVPVYRWMIEVGRLRSKLKAAISIAARFWRLRRQFDVVHLHGFSQKNVLFFTLGRLTGKKLVWKLTSAGADDPLSLKARSWVGFQCLARVDCAVSVSPRLSELFRASRLPQHRLRVIPNGVDTERFLPATPAARLALRQELGLRDDRPIILSVGFFSRDKGADIVFDAWTRLEPARNERATLIFVGTADPAHPEVDPTMAQAIRREIRRLDAEGSVRFVDQALEIEKYYRAADVFVLASRREGLPNALLEAMASGLPSVVTALPGITDWVVRDGENGLVFPPGDARALAERLAELLADPARRDALGTRARATVLAQCSIDHVKDTYFDLYRSLATA